MRKFGIIALLFVTSCGENETQVPSEVISVEQMIPILVDVHIVEGARNGTLILGDTNDIEDYYAKIYEKYNISEEKFKRSFSFYNGEPELFIPIYEKVLDSLKANGAVLARKGIQSTKEQ
ncbi:MAG: hypothetical protein CMP53_05920 [Flavobacteriales bacterium]|jgi:hypothetical protein|nr:hypothetical protein [Flavobacteriales bacterium]|tara:strand:+ start:1055 stop:1414 length:360 start_codon:yes stop_codon:yes gene_type:complete